MCERDAEARGDIGRKMEKTAIGKMVVGLKIFNLKRHDLSMCRTIFSLILSQKEVNRISEKYFTTYCIFFISMLTRNMKKISLIY